MPRYCVYLDNPEEEIWSKTSSECIFYDHKEEEIERKTSITECCCYYDHQENAVERKTSIFEKDKEDIIDYCKSLINNKFYGETIDRNRRFTTYNADASVLECMDNEIDFLSDCIEVEEDLELGEILKLFDIILTRHIKQNNLTGTEDDILRCLYAIALKRKQPNESVGRCYERLVTEMHRFVEFYKQRGVLHADVSDTYWASCQQLRAGKVIADHVDINDGSMDPIFGVLLCPFAGQKIINLAENSQYSGWDNNDLPASYHAVMYDSFGYLKEFHGIGPGSDYLEEYSLFHSYTLTDNRDTLSESTGLLFWQRTLKRLEEEEIRVDINLF